MGLPTQKDHWWRAFFRLLGAIVSCLFALQAIWVIMHPPSANPWKLIHWVGQALLCLLAGGAGCYLEVKGGRALGEEQMGKFTMNRLLVSIFYFWLGCYVMDVNDYPSDYSVWQEVVARGTGIAAWVVSAGNLFVMCCFQEKSASQKKLEEKEAREQPAKSSSKSAGKPKAKPSPPPASSSASAWNKDAGEPSSEGEDESSEDLEAGEPNSAPAGTQKKGPEGGWNTVGNFGAI